MNKSSFNVHFDLAFGSKNQTRFEDWFAQLATCVFGKDFELIKAGGKDGDKKSDGRRISTETVYQCYAPESPSAFAKSAKSKVGDSFPGVTIYWPNLKEWVFVHNNADGVSTAVSDLIEELRKTYKNITIRTVSRRFLKDELHDKLSIQQLIDVYPSASLDFGIVKMAEIRPLLKHVINNKLSPNIGSNFGNIPDEAKLDYNKLCPDAKFNIKGARSNVGIVSRYIDGMSNPMNASLIQAEMNAKYLSLRDFGYDPDEIVGKMLTFVGAEENPKVIAAGYVIVAYYFDACDIFENVPESTLC